MSDTDSPIISIRPDPEREQRKGVPEVIFGEAKETGQIISMARGLLAGSGRAIISRVRPEAVEALRAAFQEDTICIREAARMVVIYRPGYVRRSTGGHVGVISAGTSDIPMAEEAALIAEEMGCRACACDWLANVDWLRHRRQRCGRAAFDVANLRAGSLGRQHR